MTTACLYTKPTHEDLNSLKKGFNQEGSIPWSAVALLLLRSRTVILWDQDRGSVLINILGTNEAQEQLQAEPAEGFLLPPTNSSITYLLSPFLHPFTI